LLTKASYLEPVACLRLISKYCSDNSDELSLGLEIASAFGLNLNNLVLNNQRIFFSEFFAGRVTALINFYDILVRGFLALEFTKLQGVESEKAQTLAYLSNMPTYLLSLYKPGVFANLAMRTNDGYENFTYHLKQQTKLNISELIALIIQELPLPEKHKELTEFINNPPWARKRWGKFDVAEAKAVCQAHSIANIISAEIFQRSGVQGLQSVVRSLKRLSGIPQSKIEDVISKIPEFLKELSIVHNLPVIPLPEYVYWYGNEKIQDQLQLQKLEFYELFLLQIQLSLSELKKSQEYALHEAIWTTLEALLYSLGFQRACYFVFDHAKQALILEATIGVKLFDYEKTEFNLAGDSNSDVFLAILKDKKIDSKETIFKDGWPFFAFPVIYENVLSGMFYADRAKRPDSKDFDQDENLKFQNLARIWNI
jgi:hypothetical protein